MARTRVLAVVAATMVLNANAAASTDQEVLTVVLNHFAVRDDASIGADGVILLQPQTRTWTDQLMRGFSLRRGNDSCPITDELYERLSDRNSAEIPSHSLLSPSDKWRIATDSELKPGPFGFSYKADSGTRVRTLADVVRPAYSSTEDAAFVMFFFKW